MQSERPFNGQQPSTSLISAEDARSRSLQTGLAPQNSEQGSTLNPMSIVHAMRRRWKIGAPLGLILAGALGVISWVFLEPKYTANALLRVSASVTPLLFQTADNVKVDFKLFKNTQLQLIKAPFVLNAALNDSEVMSLPDIKNQVDPINFLEKELVAKFPGDGELMQVTYSSTSGKAAVKVVNAVVEAFNKEVIEKEKRERNLRLDRLVKVRDETEARLKSLRERLKKLAESLGTGDSESLSAAEKNKINQYGLMVQELSKIEFELMQAQGQLDVANSIAEALAAREKGRTNEQQTQYEQEKEASIDAIVDKTPDVARVKNEIDQLQGQIRTLSQTFGNGYPLLKTIFAELKFKEELLARLRGEARPFAIEQLEKGTATERGTTSASLLKSFEVLTIEKRIQILQNQQTTLKKRVEELDGETRKLGMSSIDIEMERSEIKGLEEVLHRIEGEIERTIIEKDVASRIEVVSRASSAIAPDIGKRIIRTAAMSLLGLFAPLALLMGWDLTHRRVDSSDAMSGSLSIPTLGSVPKVSQKILFRNPPPGHRLEGERIRLIESIDSVGSMVQFLARSDSSKVFLVTSAIPSEGKSTIACQLADSLARSGNRVILVDLDLRKPSVNRYLKLNNEPGVSEVLAGEVTVSDAIQSFGNDGLNILSAGTSKQSMQVLCTNGSLERLLAKLRDEYDFVIVDSSPVLPVADTRSMVKYCDSVILTLVRDHSRLPLVSQAAAVLQSYRARIVGGVIIGVNSLGYGKSYYYAARNKRGGIAHAPEDGTEVQSGTEG